MLAGELALQRPEEAAAEYVWLWRHMLKHEPMSRCLRHSFMASAMKRLASDNDAARGRFAEVRDALTDVITGEEVDPSDLADWVTLNRIIGDQGATLAWFDRVKDDARWATRIDGESRDLERVLINADRWADAGRVYRDPVSDLERDHSIFRMVPRDALGAETLGSDRELLEELPAIMFREQTAEKYAGLLAAGRDDLAAKYAARALELDDSARMAEALAEKSLSIGQARTDQVGWLTAAAQKDPSLDDLRARIEAAIREPGGE